MNHKRKRAKHQRSGCLLCKPHKITCIVKAGRRKAKKVAFAIEERAY